MSNEPPRSIQEVIGANLRAHREREGWGRTDVALRMSEAGLAWTAQVVGDVERGDRALTVPELLLAPFALGVNPRDLLAGDGTVMVAEDMAVRDLAELRRLFTARPARPDPNQYLTPDWFASTMKNIVEGTREAMAEAKRWWPDHGRPKNVIDAGRAAGGEAEVKAARRLGVTPFVVSLVAHRLWGESLTARRDRLVDGDGAVSSRSLQARRGHVTRQLLVELAQIIDQES